MDYYCFYYSYCYLCQLEAVQGHGVNSQFWFYLKMHSSAHQNHFKWDMTLGLLTRWDPCCAFSAEQQVSSKCRRLFLGSKNSISDFFFSSSPRVKKETVWRPSPSHWARLDILIKKQPPVAANIPNDPNATAFIKIKCFFLKIIKIPAFQILNRTRSRIMNIYIYIF